MKNKPFKLVLTVVIVGMLVFGALFAKATTNEEMIKTLQSLIQMLMQIVAQLQAQLAQKLTTTTTIPITTCTDSDGGNNIFIKGTVVYNNTNYTDSCET
ncbi:MAG: hypothetical protein ACP5PR_00935, partial [Minisyncoccia bacterium]